MRINNKFVTTSIVAVALLATTPALADSRVHGHGEAKVETHTNAGLHLGSWLRFFADEKRDTHREDKDKEHATTRITGSVVAINGTTLTVTDTRNKTFAVDVSDATFLSLKGDSIALADIKVGDSVAARGTLVGSVLTASSVRDLGTHTALKQRVGVLGTLSALSGSSFVVSSLGTSSNVTVHVTSDTKFRGDASSSGDLENGAGVLVIGSTSSTSPNTITASLVLMFEDGVSFFKNFFK